MECKVTGMKLVKNPESARKAYCSVIIDDIIILNDIAVVQGKFGLFPSMPHNISLFLFKENRDIYYSTILRAYYEKLEEENI